MKTLDRYIIREVLPPFGIAILVFTFILIIPFIIELAEQMIAKGVPWPVLLRLMTTLLPSALALTIPMALLIGLLVAFGRLSSDREIVVLLACGISPYRLLRPVALLALAAWAGCSWVMLRAMPDANQAFREMTLQIVADRAEGEVRPRVFFEDFPGLVLYVRDIPLTGGWQQVLAADTKDPAQPVLFLARSGRMVVDREARTIQMVLEDGARHTTTTNHPEQYEILRFERMLVSLDPESVFPRTGPARGEREMSIPELQARIRELEAAGQSPHNPIMEIQKKFSIPVACFVFALLGLALGVSNRKDGKLASFVLGIGVIFIYYVIMFTAQAMTKGKLLPAWLSMWLPNLALGIAGIWLLVSRTRGIERPLQLPRFSWMRARVHPGAQMTADAGGRVQRSVPTSVASPQAAERHGALLHWLRPTILDSYLVRRYLHVLVMTMVAMLGLFYISTFIDLSDKWFKGQTTLAQLSEFLWWSTPQFLAYIIALAVLISALVTIGILTKNSELIVMRACGISLYRTVLPLVACAALASAVLFLMEEHLLAIANRRADELRHLIRGGSAQTFDVLNRKWVVGRTGEIYHYQFFNPSTLELNGVSRFDFDTESRQLSSRLYAARATFNATGGEAATAGWTLSDGWRRMFATDRELFEAFAERTSTMEPAEYFMTEIPEPRRMNHGQLEAYINDLRQSGYDVREHEVELHRKTAFPFVTLVMTCIAIPFAVTTGRRGAMYGIGIGIALALVYWTTISVCAALGASGVMSPLLAAWAPNLLFGAAGLAMLLTVRT
ncbi:MAG: LPS export ABC transporter permease LptF [Acidobacteria bacterium]|nr:LPS export ABC transporter permease LptF [Acidobacteriota bacterium]